MRRLVKIFQDNVLKEYLKNVYFITGTPCGGKTTVSRALAKRYGLTVYDIDERFDLHQKVSDPTLQPAMNKRFANADAFFGRSVEDYERWLTDNTREQLDFVLLDLIRLSQDRVVLCDCHLTVEEARRLTDPDRIVFLIKDPDHLVEDYCNRPDHQGFSRFLHSATDVEKAKATCNETLKRLNEKRIAAIRDSEFFWLERTADSTVGQTVNAVARHFGLMKPETAADTVEIRKVEKGTPLADQLVEFVKNFSWEEVKEHTLQSLREWPFTDWETMFAAVAEGKIVGMASLLKTDYYPLPEICPWVSSLFVTEEYRGLRISQMLIDYANGYARELGFDKTYIPSEHIGLYEKYGYRYLKDIVNYGGDTDRLYVKEL